jgi:hypothetical protein
VVDRVAVGGTEPARGPATQNHSGTTTLGSQPVDPLGEWVVREHCFGLTMRLAAEETVTWLAAD